MFSAFISATFPVFVIAATGFLLSKRSDLMNHPGLSQLTTQIAIPALILHSILKLQVDVTEMLHLVAATALCLAVGALLTLLLCKLRGISPRFYISTLVNPNTGNFGIPLTFVLLGEESLAAAVIVSTTVTLSHWTLGVTAMSGRYQWDKLVKNVPLQALLLGGVLSGFDLMPPMPVMRVLDMLAGLAQPIMLMLLGHSLAQLKLRQRRELGILALLSIYRPLSGALIAFAVTRFIGLDPLQSLVLMMQMAMPVAVMSYVLTLRYQGPADRIAALTLTSMPATLVVLAVLYALQGSI